MGVQYGRRGKRDRSVYDAIPVEAQRAVAAYADPRPVGPPSTANPAWGVPITGAELLDTDTIVHIGRHYPVDRIEPGKGRVRYAYSGAWGRTVAPDDTVRILPRPAP